MVRIAPGLPEEERGVDTRAPPAHAEVQVRPGRAPGAPDGAHPLAPAHLLALGDTHAAHVHVHRDERVPVVDEDRVAAEELVGHHRHGPVGDREDGRALRHGVVGAPVGAAGAPVDDAAVAEATARGQGVERLPERQGEEARPLPSPQPGHLAVLAVDPREVLRRELDHVGRQGELLDRVVELPHPDGGRLAPSGAAPGELERACRAKQVDGKGAGAGERLEAPRPELAPLDALARPAHQGPRPDRGRRLRPGTGRGRAERDRGGESRERPSSPLAQRGPVRRLTSRRSATRTTTRMTSAVPVPACDLRNSTRAPTTAPRARTEARMPHHVATSPRR